MDARRGPFEEFAIATAVLTRLPVGIDVPGEQGAIAAAGWAFPLVGAGIGGVPAWGFSASLPPARPGRRAPLGPPPPPRPLGRPRGMGSASPRAGRAGRWRSSPH